MVEIIEVHAPNFHGYVLALEGEQLLAYRGGPAGRIAAENAAFALNASRSW